jgi:D-alanine--poly(phosphoribitol) ligase subunit 2
MSTPARIDRIFRDALEIEPPAPDVDLVEAGILDSLALVTLLFEIEEQLGVRIPLEDLEIDDVRTSGRLAALVDSLGARTDGASGAA